MNENNATDYIMTVAKWNSEPVIDKNHRGSADNDRGYENGHVIKINETYHMVITERFDFKTRPERGGSVPARVGYWTSGDGDNWTRICTIVQGTATGRADDYEDPKNNTWSASWYWNEDENRWNIFWRGQCPYIYRYKSEVEGHGGMAGPYSEAKQISPPIEGVAQKWAGEIIASFSNIFIAQDGKYYSFYACGVEEDDWRYAVGLLNADSIDGPWTRTNPGNNAIFVYAENPYVYIYDNSRGEKVYFCVYDDLSDQHSIGYGYSTDGIHWTGKTLDLTGCVDWAQNDWFVASVRTPCSLIKEDDGTYTVIFTAYGKDDYYNIGRVNVNIDEVPKPSDEHVVFPGDMKNWHVVRGNFRVHGREYCQNEEKHVDSNSVYTDAVYVDVTVEATLRYVNPVPGYDEAAKAGVHVRKADIDGSPFDSGYHAYLTTKETVQLYAGDKLLAEANVCRRPAIFRKLKLCIKGNNIKVYYNGAAEPCINMNDDTYTGEGYVGLDVFKSHWHYEKVEIVACQKHKMMKEAKK